MIQFIVLDDKKEFRKRVKDIIDVVMAKEDISYKCIEFEKYNSNFEKVILDKAKSKIYIMDIEIPDSKSGIDISRKIRETDWDSIIVLLTSHSELAYEVLKAQIMILDFISKYNNWEQNLKQVIKKSLLKVDKKKVINFKTNGIHHRIYIDDILYIEKDPVERKCHIKTTYSSFPINKSLNEMVKEVDERFYQSHRSCIVNTERIRRVNFKEGIICFDDGSKCDLLSREKKKGLKKYVGVD